MILSKSSNSYRKSNHNEGLKHIYGNVKAETCKSLSPSSHTKENPSWNMHLAYCANMKVESGVWKFYYWAYKLHKKFQGDLYPSSNALWIIGTALTCPRFQIGVQSRSKSSAAAPTCCAPWNLLVCCCAKVLKPAARILTTTWPWHTSSCCWLLSCILK